MIKRFNHLGIAVRDLDAAIAFFEGSYGARLVSRQRFEDQKMESAFVTVGEAQFELSATLDPQGVIGRFIDSRGEGIHHISLEVEDFDRTIETIKGKGLRVISEANTDDFKAAFVHPQSSFGVLTEIIQPKTSRE